MCKGTVVGLVLAVVLPAVGSQASEFSPIRAAGWPTAHNLKSGQFQVEFFSIPPEPLSLLQVDIGVTDRVQLGIRPLAAAFGDIGLFGKYGLGGAEALKLAIPFQVAFQVPSWTFSIHGGWVVGWPVLPWLTVHPGLLLRLHPGIGVRVHVVLQVHFFPQFQVWGAVSGPDIEVGLGGALWLAPFVFVEGNWRSGEGAFRLALGTRF